MPDLNELDLNVMDVQRLTSLSQQLEESINGIFSNSNQFDHLWEISEFDKQKKRTLCRAKEWQNKAFFIIVVGPVKSGKSTLVNLLARAKVSPTDYLECTVKPSIISRSTGEDSTITTFTTKDSPTLDEVESIIDYVKGLDNDLTDGVDIEEPCPLNDDNLKSKVAFRWNPNGNTTALTSITVPGGELLKDDVYIIDMPGFDGVRAGISDDFYTAVISRADLVLFVQSSNMAINNIANDFCEILGKNNALVPVFFLHNYFDSLYWHSEKERKQITEGHLNNAEEFFKENHIAISRESYKCINLCKVDDARNKEFISEIKTHTEHLKMLEDEKNLFSKFEKELYEKLSANKNKVRLRNCVKRTTIELVRLKKIVEDMNAELMNIVEKYKQEKEKFEELRKIWEVNELKIDWNADSILLSDLRNELCGLCGCFCENINGGQKYNTDATREKALDLIDLYIRTTSSFYYNKFNSVQIGKDIRSSVRSSFLKAIEDRFPNDLELNTLLDLNLDEFKIDFNSIGECYDVEEKIPQWPITRTRRGTDVVNEMINVERTLYGMPTHATGYILQEFYMKVKNEINEWIKKGISSYKEAYAQRISEIKEVRLKNISEDIDSIIDKVNGNTKLIECITGCIPKIKD